ncbi:MAG: SsrA-binding protein, partial [Acidobacteria bacterium]|nr:SsrA-binding protein [Acidobacteriota bacterium]
TIVPRSIYLKDGRVKVESALARGKRLYDKREAARRKTIDREVEAALKGRRS